METEDKPTPDLDLVPTKELIDELMKRGDSVVGAVLSHDGLEKAFAKGNPRWIIGALATIQRDMMMTSGFPPDLPRED